MNNSPNGTTVNNPSNGSTMPVGPHRHLLTEKIAIAREIMWSDIGQVLGRVSVVNYEGETIFDTFAYHSKLFKVKELNAGIECADIDPANGAQSFPKVQAQLLELFRDRIVIGHDIERELGAISMPCNIRRMAAGPPPTIFTMAIRDTEKYSRYQKYSHPLSNEGPILHGLARAVLGRRIPQGRRSTVEDAVATMEVYRKAEAGIDGEMKDDVWTMEYYGDAEVDINGE